MVFTRGLIVTNLTDLAPWVAITIDLHRSPSAGASCAAVYCLLKEYRLTRTATLSV
jgi:hypothetical protein